MSAVRDAVNTAFRDYQVEGVPASGVNDPSKAEVRAIGGLIDTADQALAGALLAGAVVVKDTLAHLAADLAHAANTLGVVWSDGTVANNGVYAKVGGSGAGSWSITGLTFPAIVTEELAAIADAAQASRDQAVAAAEAIGPQLFYDTKADATAALAGIANNAVVEVFADESLTTAPRSIYRKVAGALALKVNLGMFADLVSWVPGWANSFSTAISTIFSERVSIMRFIPASEHAAIYARTSAFDTLSALVAAKVALGARGGVITYPAGRFYMSGGFSWGDCNVIIDGAGGGNQPGTGTEFLFAAGLTYGFNPQNGAAGLGAASQIRNCRILGQDTAAAANHDGILVQCNSFITHNVFCGGLDFAHAWGGYGKRLLSDNSTAAINSNNVHSYGLKCYNNWTGQLAEEGANSNVSKHFGPDLIGRRSVAGAGVPTGIGWSANSFLGGTLYSPHFADNDIAIQVGAVSRNNRTVAAYVEADGAATAALKMLLGGGENNEFDFAENSQPIIDLTANGGNSWNEKAGGLHRNRLAIGGAGVIDFLIQAGVFLITGGKQIQLQDNPLTANWFIQALAGDLYLNSPGAGKVRIDNALSVLGAATVSSIRVGANQVVGARGAAVANATNAGDVITQLNAFLAIARTHGLIAP
jgi:hypothetical protein